MKQTKLNLLSALLLVAAMAFGTSAWATTKTVTYTITDVEEGNSSTTITFTRSGDTPFGGGSTTYTVIVSNSYLGQNGGQGNFSVDLADGFHLNLSWQSGSNIGFTNLCIRPQASGKQITYNVLCNDANYYVTHLKLTGLEGTWTDIDIPINQQWNFSRSISSGSSLGSVTFTYADAPTLDIFEADGVNAYKIKSKDDLRHLANYVNKGHNSGSGITFRQTTDITCDNTYTPIGTSSYPFGDTYDGQEHTISSITVTKDASYLGFFGYINGGTVKDLVISNSNFSGIDNIGAIAGTNHNGTIENCVVESNVNINFRTNSTSYHGGIVGSNGANALIIGCRCAAVVIGTDCSSASQYGGIAGSNAGTIQNCLYTGNQVNGNSYNGTLVGQNSGTLTNNYYTNGSMPGGLGVNGQTNGADGDGARRARTVTMGDDVQLNGAETATYSLSGITAIGTGSYAMRYNNLLYSGATQNIAFSYNASPALGYVLSSFNATNGGTFSGNILTMPNADVNVTATFTDVWGVTNNPAADGSQDHPYIITTTAGLDLLAKNVNGTDGYSFNKFSGIYFKLGNHITYNYEGLGENESNYTAIGHSQTIGFCGIFDGDNYTISGIRIHTTDDNQGLFGWVEGESSAVMNVTLSDAVIIGGQQVGGIAGYISSKLVNCLVLGTTLGGTDKVGAIAGYKTAIGYEYYHNYYRNCTVNGTANATNVGLGAEPGYGNNTPHDNGGARSLHIISLGDNISASGNETVEIDNVTYYASASTITLTYGGTVPEGYALEFIYNDGTENHTVTPVEDVYSFTMPSADITVSTNIAPIDYSISYDLGGGELPSGQSNPATYNLMSSTFTLVNPIDRTGYVFTGWTGTGLTEATQTVTIAQGSMGDRSYTANWIDAWGMADGADGSEEHPYIITTTVGLDLLATEVNAGHSFYFKNFILGADIDYSTKPLVNGENYTAIGGDDIEFAGTFDGCGHTVSGIRINKTGNNDADEYQGLFGYVEGTVKNVTLSDADITGYEYVGGIVGFMNYSATVHNCHVTGSVELHAVQNGAWCFGGIVGECGSNEDHDPNTITDCSSSATLTVADGLTNCKRFGGIVGYLKGDLQNCLVIGAVLPSLQYGDMDYSGAIAGGVDGYARLYNNYYYGVTLYNATSGIGIGLDYATDEHHDLTKYDGAVPAYTLTLGEHISASPTASLVYNHNDYYKPGTTVTLSAEGYTLNGGFTVKDAQNNDVPLIGGNTFVMPDSDVTVTANLTVIDWSGSGEEDDPYIIMYRSQLDLLAERVNGGNDYFGKFFKLEADIDYPHNTAWNDATSTENNFTVIGDRYQENSNSWNTHIFNGVFDGDSHTISGIRIYRNGGTDADENQGLFGNVGQNGIVKNVTLTDVRITAASYAGGISGNISGNISNGTIENCHVTGTVAIHAVVNCYSHGGIVGRNDDGTVRGCTSAATLSKAADLLNCGEYGGIVGNNQGNNATVEDCLAVGVTVNANYNAGAIFGYTETNYYDYHHGNNYYYGCNANGNTSNIGSGGGDIYKHDGAAPCYKLTLPTGLTARGDYGKELICYQGNLYVTLDLTLGQTVVLVPVYPSYTIGGASYNDGENHTISLDEYGYYSFVVTTAHDITVSVTWGDIPNWSGHGEKDNPYLITNCAELNALAIMVNNGSDYEGYYFKLGADINYPHATAWNDVTSTENNYTAIGMLFRKFKGHFDGNGHTISGIRIYKDGGTDDADSYQGLFGYTDDCYVYNLTLTDTRITGFKYVGGIVGYDYKSNIANCHVTDTVAIHAVTDNSQDHGGIAGNTSAHLTYCTSAATLSVAHGVTGCKYFGGIAGNSSRDLRYCLAQGVTISGAANKSGAIVGDWDNDLQYNYYHNCSYGSAMVGIGSGEGDESSSDGAMQAEEMSVTIPGYGEGNGRWAFIASPMYNTMTPYQVQNLMTTTATHYDLYLFNQDAAGAEWQNYKAHAYFDSHDFDFLLNNGQGYLYASKEDVTLTFLGRINGYKDSTPIYLSYTEGKPLAGYNLVGNPYPVAAYVDMPYYKMNAAGDDVEVVEEYWANSIPACSGVVVVATGKNQKVWFSATAPEAPSSSTGGNGSIQMTLTKANERGDAFQDKAIVSFNEGMQLGKFIFNEDHAKLYIPKDGNDYAIVSAEAKGEIPLNFKARENGDYVLNFSGDVIARSAATKQSTYIHLIDNLTGADVDLLATPSYTFTARYDDYASRFRLVFSVNENNNENNNEDFAFISNGEIIINGTGTLQVIDLLGRQLFTREANSEFQIPHSAFPAGVYVLRLINGENMKTQKIVIK